MSDPEENIELVESLTNTSIPMLMCDKVKRDDEIWYMLRLTPENNNYGVEDILDFLKGLSDNSYFLSQELSKKAVNHYHCVFLSYKDPREDIKLWLVSKFPGTWKKQDGNKRYNLQVVEDIDKAFTYTSKDGDYYIGSDINPKYIEYVNSQSFQKKDARLGQLNAARELYINGNINIQQLFSRVCNILIDFSPTGSLNPQVAKNFVIGARGDREGDAFFETLYNSIF